MHRWTIDVTLVERPNVLSIWVGTIADETKFRRYLQEQYDHDSRPMSGFCGDMEESFYDHDVQEAMWHAVPQRIVDLLKGHSWAPSFSDAVLRLAGNLRIDTANAIVILYEREFEGKWPRRSPLRFLGSCPYRPE